MIDSNTQAGVQTNMLRRTSYRNYAIAFLLALIGVIYFLPSLMYVGNRFGIDVTNTKKVLGLSIDFESKWYPIASSDTLLGKIIISTEVAPSVIYCNINWINPWDCDQVWISKSDVWNTKNPNVFESVHQYSWGGVGVVKDTVSKTDRKLAIIQSVGIGISGKSLDILNDIKTINFTSISP